MVPISRNDVSLAVQAVAWFPDIQIAGRSAGRVPHRRQIAALQCIKRNGTPEDQAAVVSFLAAEEAGFITGQSILIDGGQGRT